MVVVAEQKSGADPFENQDHKKCEILTYNLTSHQSLAVVGYTIRLLYIDQPIDISTQDLICKTVNFSTNQNSESVINQSQFAGRSYKVGQFRD